VTEPGAALDASTLAVHRHRNRLRLVATLLIATVLYWLAVCIAAVTIGLVLALRVLLEGGDFPSSGDDLKLLGIGLGGVIVVSAVIGSVVALVRLPRQRRRLEQQVLTETGAQVITGDESHRRVRNILDALAIAADLPPPRFAVVDDPAPNSFAVGTRPATAIVAVTQGAIEGLARDELEAVLAYEVSRIGSWDVALSSWTVALTGAAIGALDDDLSQFVGRLPFRASVRLRRWALRDTALDRDRAAVRFTRNPVGLLRALEALRRDPAEVQRVSPATAPLWMEVPAAVDGADATLDDRIAELRVLAGVGPAPAAPDGPPPDASPNAAAPDSR
jgi:heat shock protein HtpX